MVLATAAGGAVVPPAWCPGILKYRERSGCPRCAHSLDGSTDEELDRVLVVMVMESRYPFGKDWAVAARAGGADVVEVEVVPHAVGPRIAAGVAGSDDHFQIERVQIRPDRVFRPLSDWILGRRIARVIEEVRKRRRVDIIHTHFYREMGPILHMRGRPAHVHTEHSAAFAALDLGSAAHYRLSKAGLKVAIKGAAGAQGVIAVCRYLADQMMRHGVPGPIQVIPCPIDPEMTGHLVRPPSSPPRLVTVGRLSPEKRVDLVLGALALARGIEPKLELDIVGGGPLEHELRAHADRLGLGSAVRFHGPLSRERVAEVAAPAAAFVTGTLSEMFGTAVAEALCLGVPAVAPAVGGLAELIDSSNGRLVPEADAPSLAEAVLEVVATTYDRDAIAQAARGHWSFDRVGSELAALYSSVIDVTGQEFRGGA